MKILVTNLGLDGIAGTETYCYSLISELVKRGHNLQCYTETKGLIAKKIEEDFKVKTFENIEELDRPDIIHGHHKLAEEARNYFDVPLVFVSHGITEFEKPVQADKLFVVSEEVQGLYGGKILRNGICLNRFKPLPLEKKRDVLYLDKQKDTFDIERLINESYAVIAKGRGALEAMACNVPTILLSKHGFGKVITEDNFHQLKKYNFSARNTSADFCQLDIDLEVNKVLNIKNYQMRYLIKREFNIKDMVNRLEMTYREIL